MAGRRGALPCALKLLLLPEVSSSLEKSKAASGTCSADCPFRETYECSVPALFFLP